MKKLTIFVMLLLSTSMAMAQFGDIDDILSRAQEGKGSQNDSAASPNDPKTPGGGTYGRVGRNQLIEKSIIDGLFLIKQDFQLEDTTTGNRYNWGDAKEFGGAASFMVRYGEGFITTEQIYAPWNYDENYPQYKGQKYKPVPFRTSFKKVGQSDWEVQSAPLQFTLEGELANGLCLVKDKNVSTTGFVRAKGIGKKEVWVMWLMASEDEDGDASMGNGSFRTSQMTITLESGKKLYEMAAPSGSMKPIGGIVVEPVFKGVGQIELALVGVIANYNDKFQMALLGSDSSIDGDESTGSQNLTPEEEKDKKDKSSSKKHKK